MLIKRKYLFGTTILAGVMAVAAPAFAQSQLPGVTVQGQSDQDATQIEEVVVTGSRIRRDPTNSPTPLITVDREQLLTTGQSTVIDYLATIPALSNSLVPSDTTGSGLGDGGLSFANLRSLGTGRTLTLVDGKRHVGSSGGSLSVDVDAIPRLLIENIEIVTGGASSVYGADAVSGVLNFVLRKDFEGVEIDANYGMINQGGEANKRVSALMGVNLLNDRLNLWAFGEYEQLDELRAMDVDWLRDSYALVGVDVDPTASPNDGIIDARVFSHVNTMQRLRWGVVNIANNQPASPTSDPDIPYNNCTNTAANHYAVNCMQMNPGYTWVFEGTTARLADFGTRIGTGISRTLNVGGDGEPASEYGQYTFFPEGENKRFAAGANFALTPDIMFRFEAKHIEEETFDEGQPTFFDIFINDDRGVNQVTQIRATSAYTIRLSDNAFIPANLRSAILGNQIRTYTAPTATTPSQPTATLTSAPYARNALRGPDRSQLNNRELNRYVASLEGNIDRLLFVDNIRWDLSYTYGEVDVSNRERGVDVERMAFASDAVVDTAGEVNGRPGEIVCRVQLAAKRGETNPAIVLDEVFRAGADVRDSAAGRAAINECVPLNVFGKGNQSQEALDYIYAEVGFTDHNEQEQAVAAVSGEMFDIFGAGKIGVALGVEYRREFTEGTGREGEVGDRLLFLNTSPDQPAVEYESEEVFAEVSIPLFRDSWLGEYAELSGSYRYFDYTTAGTGDVYGVNFVYRPIRDIAFKTSFNTSFRAPNLAENFSPYGQTFANFAFSDPCSTANINAAANAQYRTNRLANCQALLNQYNAAHGTALTFDFANATPGNTADDFDPSAYGTGGTAGVAGGNPFLQPETSDSFTFSTVIQPRMFPDFSLVLDYYEIQIDNVIASVSAVTAAEQCVNGSTLNTAVCATIFRDDPSRPFLIGRPTGDPIGGFIQGSINYAKRTSRGLDFTARYSLDLEEAFGHNWGRLDYRVAGTWLLEQKNFNDITNLSNFTQSDGDIYYPRVRLTSSLNYTPNDTWSFNWTMDWQASQDNASTYRDYVLSGNLDARDPNDMRTGAFARHDFTVRWNARDDLSVRFGVVNAFDAEQPRYLGSTLTSNFDPWGTRFFVGLNYRPF
ncbi:TonB-dependent receptor domain-containing protein [Brevundimonas sp. FT23028]|uniref:TonB-dependent receptor domain-containing protein n=1 Tax=Brevundimonas sp. FT23028 TaxID=3393748 RepID=UPI003B588C55